MSSKMHTTYVSKTQLYLKVKKPQLERERRARINKHLDALKQLIAEFQQDDAILRMDKAEMLESALIFMRTQGKLRVPAAAKVTSQQPPMESFRNGYMNAVNEVSRVMAATPGMNVEMGKAVMVRLGCEFNRLLHYSKAQNMASESPKQQILSIEVTSPMSPASSGYHSDYESSPMASPVLKSSNSTSIWRPW